MSARPYEVVPFVPPAWEPSGGIPALKITNVYIQAPISAASQLTGSPDLGPPDGLGFRSTH